MHNSEKVQKSFRNNSVYWMISTISVLALTGCSGLNLAPTTSTPSATSTTNKVAEAIPTPSTAAPVLDDANPIHKACSDLISIEALYDFNPNFSYDASQSPTSGSLGEKAKQKDGVFCSYVNLSNGDRIDIAAAQISTSSIGDWTKRISESNRPTDAYGNPPETLGFFSRSNNEGVSQAIQGNKWVAISSSTFYEAGDASSLMSQVLHSLAN